MQFKADKDMLTTADSGKRNWNALQIGVFHTTENSDNTAPDVVATWQLNPNNESSYHVLVGTDGRTIRSNDDEYVSWSAGPTGNSRGLHCSAIGYAARDRNGWLRRPKQIEQMARWAAHCSKEYGLPLVKLSAEDVRAGKRGFCGHAEVSIAWHEVNHMDPGAGFPWDVVLNRATDIRDDKVKSQPKKAGNGMSTDEKVTLILEQLAGHPAGKFEGWPQLGGRTLVDAVAKIGEHLEIDGFKAP